MSDRLLRLPELVRTVGLTRSSIYRHIKAGKFPPPVKLGSASAWVESEVQAWITHQIASGRPSA